MPTRPQVLWSLAENLAALPDRGAGGSAVSLVRFASANLPPVWASMEGHACTQFFGNSGANGNGLIGPGDAAGSGTTVGESPHISVKCTVRLSNLGLGDYQTLARKRYNLYGDAPVTVIDAIQFNLNNGNNGEWYVGLSSSAAAATYIVCDVAKRLAINTWYTFGFSYDGTTIRLYRDGVLSGSGAFAGPIDFGTHGPWMVGGYKPGAGVSNSITGFMKDVEIANEAMTADWFTTADSGYALGYADGVLAGTLIDAGAGGGYFGGYFGTTVITVETLVGSTTATAVPVPSPFEPGEPGLVDHVADALSRLAEQYKDEDA